MLRFETKVKADAETLLCQPPALTCGTRLYVQQVVEPLQLPSPCVARHLLPSACGSQSLLKRRKPTAREPGTQVEKFRVDRAHGIKVDRL